MSMQAPFRWSHSLRFVVGIALLVRILAVGIGQNWPLNQTSPLWRSGPEIINIASSIARHKGFSSPFGIESGPTAWIPPVYPTVIAAIFIVFGLQSNVAAIVILALQALLSALTCVPIWAIAQRIFDEDSAAFASWGWALFPYEILMPGLFIWETALSGFLLTLLCGLTMKLRQTGFWMCLAAGALWGVAALTNTALISVMPVSFLLLDCRNLRSPTKSIATLVFASVLVVSPWILRNRRYLGAWVPVRSNFGQELWIGNHEGGQGRIAFGLGPAESQIEREHYCQLGELSYVTQRRTSAMNFIRENPTRFGRNILYRFRYWWFAEGETAPLFTFYRCLTIFSLVGVAIALRNVNRVAIIIALAAIGVYPLVYYLTDVYARYRYPVEPLMMIFAGFAASRILVFCKDRAQPVSTK